MNMKHETSDGDMQGLLERLVCDDLDDAARRRLLAWLEQDLRRWRLCGLAFLEAQTWSQALSQWPNSGIEPHTGQHSVERPARQPKGRVRRAMLAGSLAACVVLAFGLGLTTGKMLPTERSGFPATIGAAPMPQRPGHLAGDGKQENDTVLAAVMVQPGAGLGAASMVHVPVVPASSGPAQAARPAGIPEYVRQQWERRGYKLTTQRRYLFAKLPDGEQVLVPVEQVMVNQVPFKVY
jgi:hypothetical protein